MPEFRFKGPDEMRVDKMSILEPRGRRTEGLLKITSEDGEELVSIGYDLEISYGPSYDPDETAKVFWESLAKAYGHLGLRPGVTAARYREALQPFADIADLLDQMTHGGPPSPLLAIQAECEAARAALSSFHSSKEDR